MTRPRRGLALVPVVVLMAALLFVALTFATAVQRALRTSRLGWQGERAGHVADAVLLRALASWDRSAAAALRPGESDTLSIADDGEVRTGVHRTRLSARQFALEAWAEVQDGGLRRARRVVGRTARLAWPLPPVAAAVTVLGAVQLRDGTEVLGADAVPAGWADECAMDHRVQPLAALVSRSATVAPGAVVSGFAGAALMLSASQARDLELTFDSAYTALVRVATVSTADSVLVLASPSTLSCPRWLGEGRRGSPADPACTRAWPVLHATHTGSLRLTGVGPVQGVLLVDGDLHLDASVAFHGLLLVRGRVHVQAAQVTGALVVRDERARGSELDQPRIQASQCAIRRALAAAGDPEPVGWHGWSERP